MKNSVLFFLVFLLIPIFIYPQDPDLIAHWSFDDSTANDHSGNGYHGTLVNNPIPDIGVKGACFRFKGKDAWIEENKSKSLIGDYISIPRIPLETYPEFTITMWVNEEKLEFVGGSGYIFFGEVFKAWAGIYHAGHYPDPTLWIKFSTGSINDEDEPVKQDYWPIFNNSWMFYALVYKQDTIHAYFHGKKIGQKYQPVLISGNRAGIATNWWYYDNQHRQSAAFTGRIDEVKIYKRALTDKELEIDTTKKYTDTLVIDTCSIWMDYQNFSNLNYLNNVGSTAQNGAEINLTESDTNLTGALWFNKIIPVNKNFWTEFSFKLSESDNNGQDDGSLDGGEGLSFVIQGYDSLALGSNKEDLAYSGLNSAVAIEFDTYKNQNTNDPNGNHIAVQVSDNGTISSIHNQYFTKSINDSILTIENDKTYYARIEYNHNQKNLKVYLSDIDKITFPVIDISPIDLSHYITTPDSGAYFGFTSSTGIAVSKHILNSWQLCSEGEYLVRIDTTETDSCRFWIDYPDFADSDALKFVGRAVKTDSAVRLTRNVIGDAGAVWYQSPVSMDKNFWTEFSFIFKDGDNFNSDDGSLPGADGMAFVIQSDGNAALGQSGGEIGYGKLRDAVVIEFDTYSNDNQQIENYFDPNGNHVALMVSNNGIISAKHLPEHSLALNETIFPIENEKVYYSRVEYNHEKKNIKVFISKDNKFTVPVIDYSPIDITGIINDKDNTATIGFTSATGSAAEKHYLLSWKFCSEGELISDVGDNIIGQSILQLSPNPVNDYLSIDITGLNEQIESIEIVNYLGMNQSVYSATKMKHMNSGSNVHLNLSELSRGIYFVKINTLKNTYLRKFVKN